MPYIRPDAREELDPIIDELVECDLSPGEFNYVVTRIMDGIMMSNGVSYDVLAHLVGDLESCKLELYRRIVSPYEDIKREQNGDAYSTNIPAV